jgi:hypothetical protein
MANRIEMGGMVIWQEEGSRAGSPCIWTAEESPRSLKESLSPTSHQEQTARRVDTAAQAAGPTISGTLVPVALPFLAVIPPVVASVLVVSNPVGAVVGITSGIAFWALGALGIWHAGRS